jgi:cytochrome c5
VSKQDAKNDAQFINVFGLLIGILIAISLMLLAFARSVASRTQDLAVYNDPAYVQSVRTRLEPFTHEAVAGHDNTAFTIAAPAGATAAPALSVPKDGKALFEAVCSACHGAGVAGAPKAGDKLAWAPRIAEGKATLYQHALNGYSGKSGVMPAKGGRGDLPDDLIKQGVDYIVSLAQ